MKKSRKLLLPVSVFQLLAIVIGLGILSAIVWPMVKTTNGPEIVIYKSPTCGCCKKWASYLQDNGFKVTQVDTQSMRAVKTKMGVPQAMASCHTAIVDGYVVEGHVPVKEIRRMLEQKPAIKGITVPGMPIGSPGMEQGARKDSYDVLAIQHDGSATIYERYRN